MPRNTTLSLPEDVWTELTANDVASITFQNLGGHFILVKATTGAAPTDDSASIRYNPGQGERNVLLSDLFPGLSGRDRVWAFAPYPTRVFVSHA